MAAEALTSFLPKLVTAVSGCVKSVSSQCLAKGLIPESVYKQILELGVHTSEDKARTLLQAVKESIETDERCFEQFLSILEEELPYASRDNLLKPLRKEAIEKANSCTAVVPSSQNLHQIPREELPRESVIQLRLLLEKLEEASRKHQSACDEKKYSEERLKVKTEECEELKRALETQTQKSSTDLDDAKSKISTCESEIEKLKARVKELESIIEEQDMQAKRGKNDTIMKTRQMFAMIANQSHAAGQEKAREEMRDREHKLKMQEKDIEIQKLKEESKRQKESSDISDLVPVDALTPKHVRNLKKHLERSHADRWGKLDYTMQCHKNLALHLGFTEDEYTTKFGNAFKREQYHSEIITNLHDIIEQWVKWYPGDSRGTISFPTYSNLMRALLDQGFGDIVRELPRDISGLSEEVQRS